MLQLSRELLEAMRSVVSTGTTNFIPHNITKRRNSKYKSDTCYNYIVKILETRMRTEPYSGEIFGHKTDSITSSGRKFWQPYQRQCHLMGNFGSAANLCFKCLLGNCIEILVYDFSI